MMASNDPTVFIVDDDEAVCQALSWLLKSTNMHAEIFSNAQDFLSSYTSNRKGCLLIDVRMPGMNGLELQEKLNALHNMLPVIILTGHGDIPMAVRAMRAGAFDFITKPFNNQVLLEQVQRAIMQNANSHLKVMPHDIAQRIQRLTPREREVMELVVDGKLNKEIAHLLKISISTVELHRANVMQKMQAKTIAELVKLYILSTNSTLS